MIHLTTASSIELQLLTLQGQVGVSIAAGLEKPGTPAGEVVLNAASVALMNTAISGSLDDRAYRMRSCGLRAELTALHFCRGAS